MSKLIETIAAPTAIEIKEFFNIHLDKARLLNILMDCGEDYDFIMKQCNYILEFNGVEDAQARGEHWAMPKYITYLNTGETYAGTIVYVPPNERFYLSTFGDMVEHLENNEGWKFD